MEGTILNLVVRFGVTLIGVLIVWRAVISAIRLLVLARGARDEIAAIVFRAWRWLFDLRAKRARTYAARDRIMAMYAPVALLSMPVVWLILITIGYSFLFWATGVQAAYDDFTLSGSSLLTLGFERQDNFLRMSLIFSEATLGLIIVAMIISYLPTMYSAFSRREAAVTMLEVRAGSPPSAQELLTRAYRIRGLDILTELWEEWEIWFAEVEESHTSLAALVFFRSPKPERSWVTAAGTILDAAALTAACIDQERDPQAELCIRAGYIALRSISDFFNIAYDPDPGPNDPISISRSEFDTTYDTLRDVGLPLKPDRDQCWHDFAGWRVNYDAVLLALAALTVAPYAPWVSDRSRRTQQRIARWRE